MVDITNPMTKFIVEVSVLALTGIIMSITVLLRKRIGEFIVHVAEQVFHLKVHSTGYIDKSEMQRDKNINSILTELRLKTKADRAQVFQFHNGVMFTSKNQMWKLTCTHEIVDTVASTQDTLQNILSSCVTDLIFSFWDDGDLSEYPGVNRVSPRACDCCTNKDNCHIPNGVYFYRVEGLKPGYSRGLLTAHKISYMLQSPLVDSNGNIIGFIGLDWCWKDAKPADIEKFAGLLCKTAVTISYELTPKK